jgi:chloramphenicol-sensitive protein RarD
VWSFVSLFAAILLLRQWNSFKGSVFAWRVLGIYTLAALLVGLNWFMYVWAVNKGHIIETSLGYFINPLLSVLIGVIFFRERLRLWQWIPIGIAAMGVLYLTIVFGSLPWIALTLAFSFALYGLVKKIAPLGSLHGLTLETIILLIPALIYLYTANSNGNGAFLHMGIYTDFLLLGTGFVTTIPLLLFASAAKRIPLSVVGLLQYIAPTTQFFIGILIYNETFTFKQFIGYCFVWLALIIFGLGSFAAYRARSVSSAEID